MSNPTATSIIVPQRRIITLGDLFRLGSSPRHYTPEDLYQSAWEIVAGLAWDQAFLANWGPYRFKYRGLIHTVADAVKYANQAIQAVMDDPYTRIMDESQFGDHEDEREGTLRGIGVVFEDEDKDGRPVISRVLETGPADKGGLKAGDIMLKVNGIDTKTLNRQDLVKQIQGEEGTTVKITVKRGDAEKIFDIVRGIINVPTVRTDRFGDVAFIRLAAFMQDDATEEMAEALRAHTDAKALIIGLRYNPGGQVMNAIRIASLFLPAGEIVSIDERIAYGGYTLTKYTLTPNQLVRVTTDRETGKVLKRQLLSREPNLSGNKPVVLLVDGHSASASEMFAGALKDLGRAKLVGKTTYGKGIGQSVHPMIGNTAAVVTSLRYYGPSGHWAGDAHKNRIGIAPHFDVDLPDGKVPMPSQEYDTQFNKAMEVAHQLIKAQG